jgi:hypothetical protein
MNFRLCSENGIQVALSRSPVSTLYPEVQALRLWTCVCIFSVGSQDQEVPTALVRIRNPKNGMANTPSFIHPETHYTLFFLRLIILVSVRFGDHLVIAHTLSGASGVVEVIKIFMHYFLYLSYVQDYK